jgi:hypothetical protein
MKTVEQIKVFQNLLKNIIAQQIYNELGLLKFNQKVIKKQPTKTMEYWYVKGQHDLINWFFDNTPNLDIAKEFFSRNLN